MQTPTTGSTTNGEQPVPKFMQWFNDNKPELVIEFPDISAADLTKVAMRKYKSIFGEKKADSAAIKTATKRKTMDDEGTAETAMKPQTGIAKLAKFGFSKA